MGRARSAQLPVRDPLRARELLAEDARERGQPRRREPRRRHAEHLGERVEERPPPQGSSSTTLYVPAGRSSAARTSVAAASRWIEEMEAFRAGASGFPRIRSSSWRSSSHWSRPGLRLVCVSGCSSRWRATQRCESGRPSISFPRHLPSRRLRPEESLKVPPADGRAEADFACPSISQPVRRCSPLSWRRRRRDSSRHSVTSRSHRTR